MKKRLFLYLDILGFSDLVEDEEAVNRLFSIIDQARIHSDSNFRAIVFSDTIVAYNCHTNLGPRAKRIEVMYLIELTQQLLNSLIGTQIFFRAIITEGGFVYKTLENIDAYYGPALVWAYRAAKSLSGTGLFLDKRLRQLNRVFRFKEFSEDFDFIYLTHQLSCMTWWLERDVDQNSHSDVGEFPVPSSLLTPSGTELLVYPEYVHLCEVYRLMNEHRNPKVREKYLTTWHMYTLGYPRLIRSLIDHDLSPSGISELDWSEAKRIFENDRT